MSGNSKNNNSVEKRLQFLEKVYLEDRERWKKNDERFQKNDERLIRLELRTETLIELVKEQGDQQKQQGETIKSLLKILHRKLEGSQ